MSSSFINFNGNGFWAKDGFVESFQLLLFEEIQEKYQDDIEWLNGYKKVLALQSLPLVYGGMSLCFDETLTDETRKETILFLIDSIINKISAQKDYLTGKRLNELRITVRLFLVKTQTLDWSEQEIEIHLKEGGFGNDLPVANYEQGFKLLRKLVTGQINYKADTPVNYWNY
jgi:hypothetical protein